MMLNKMNPYHGNFFSSVEENMSTRTTRKRKELALEDHMNRARLLRWGPREKRFLLPISFQFNLYLFKEQHRKAIQIDGRDVGDILWLLQKKYPNMMPQKLLAHHVQSLTGFQDLVVYDYTYGLFIVREHTLKDHGIPNIEALHKHPKKTEMIGRMLGIPCTVKQWDLKNNHQITIEVNREPFKVYMCTDTDLSTLYPTVLQEFDFFRAQVEEYNKIASEKIYNTVITIRCQSVEGGRYRTQTRKELNEELKLYDDMEDDD